MYPECSGHKIEAHCTKSTADQKPPRLCGKGVGAEVDTVGSIRWQFGEHPHCCRRDAEGYQTHSLRILRIAAFSISAILYFLRTSLRIASIIFSKINMP